MSYNAKVIFLAALFGIWFLLTVVNMVYAAILYRKYKVGFDIWNLTSFGWMKVLNYTSKREGNIIA